MQSSFRSVFHARHHSWHKERHESPSRSCVAAGKNTVELHVHTSQRLLMALWPSAYLILNMVGLHQTVPELPGRVQWSWKRLLATEALWPLRGSLTEQCSVSLYTCVHCVSTIAFQCNSYSCFTITETCEVGSVLCLSMCLYLYQDDSHEIQLDSSSWN